MADAQAVSSLLPHKLVPSDILLTFNASQEVWAKVLEVFLPRGDWTYVRVRSNYLPDPYLLRLHSRVQVKARKIGKDRSIPLDPVDPREAAGAVKVRQVRPSSPPRSREEELDWDHYEKQRRQPWVTSPKRPEKKLGDDIGFIPDPEMERIRQEKKRKQARKKSPGKKASKKPSLLDHYEVLGCKAGNTLSTIKKRFKKLAFKHHPDRNPGDPVAVETFKRINVAFVALSAALSK